MCNKIVCVIRLEQKSAIFLTQDMLELLLQNEICESRNDFFQRIFLSVLLEQRYYLYKKRVKMRTVALV